MYIVFDRTVLCMCIEYHIQVNMYYVSTHGVDERAINLHYYYLSTHVLRAANSKHWFTTSFLGGKCREPMIGVCAWLCVAYTIQESCTSSSYSIT